MSKALRVAIALIVSAALGGAAETASQLWAAWVVSFFLGVWAGWPREVKPKDPDVYGDGGVA